MGCDSSASTTRSPSAVTCSKRTREIQDEIYLDNFHSHKRYLTQIMASSLNGLKVGNPLAENLMVSPARSESKCNSRDDELSPQYSPMSEDSDDSGYCITPSKACSVPSETRSCPSCSPAHASTSNATCSHPCQSGPDSNRIRLPLSPTDAFPTGDLRRTALLRSVQMRAHPHCPVTCELPFSGEQDGVDSVSLRARTSQGVIRPSTTSARARLTMEFLQDSPLRNAASN